MGNRDARSSVVGILKNVLARENVDFAKSFLDNGGNPVSISDASKAILEQLNISVSKRIFYEAASVETLVAEILKAATTVPPGESLIPQFSRNADALVSLEQIGWLFVHNEDPVRLNYTLNSYEISGAVDVNSIEKSLQAIVDRNEVLRTTFKLKNQQPIQVFTDKVPVKVQFEDLRLLSETSREAHIGNMLCAEYFHTFDIEKGPLFRFRLVQKSDHLFQLIIVVHHALWDRVSTTTFQNELIEFYDHFVHASPLSLKPLPFQYADYAQWQRKRVEAGDFNSNIDYWVKYLNGATPAPALRERAGKLNLVKQFDWIFKSETFKLVTQKSRTEKVPLYSIFHYAVLKLLQNRSGKADFTLPVIWSHRNQRQFENMMGCFTGMFPIRSCIDPSDRNPLATIRNEYSNAKKHFIPNFPVIMAGKISPELMNTHRLNFLPATETIRNSKSISTKLLSKKWEFNLHMTTELHLLFEIGAEQIGLAAYCRLDTYRSDADVIALMHELEQALVCICEP